MKMTELGTFQCKECGNVDVFEGDLPKPVFKYEVGEQIPVSCDECGSSDTVLYARTA